MIISMDVPAITILAMANMYQLLSVGEIPVNSAMVDICRLALQALTVYTCDAKTSQAEKYTFNARWAIPSTRVMYATPTIE